MPWLLGRALPIDPPDGLELSQIPRSVRGAAQPRHLRIIAPPWPGPSRSILVFFEGSPGLPACTRNEV
jgi:hypothetical protein